MIHPYLKFIQFLGGYRDIDKAFHFEFYALNGVLISTPACFLMARPVLLDWTEEEIITTRIPDPLTQISLTHTRAAVHIHFASGKLAAVRAEIERHFPNSHHVTFQRNGGKLRRLSSKTLRRLTSCPFSPPSHPSESLPPNSKRSPPPQRRQTPTAPG